MAHLRWTKWENDAGRRAPVPCSGLGKWGVAEGKGVDQPRPGLEAAHAATADAPVADDALSGVVGGRNVSLLQEVAIRRPVIAETQEELLQAGQWGHCAVAGAWRGRNLAVELVNALSTLWWQLVKQQAHFIREWYPLVVQLFLEAVEQAVDPA